MRLGCILIGEWGPAHLGHAMSPVRQNSRRVGSAVHAPTTFQLRPAQGEDSLDETAFAEPENNHVRPIHPAQPRPSHP
jgi:hypothetical protein